GGGGGGGARGRGGGAGGGRGRAWWGASPSRAAAASTTSAPPSGRSVSRRQRDLMVGSRRPGAWLTTRNSERGGGSSRTLRSAFEPSGYFSSSAESTMQTRQPPSPAVEPKKPTVRRT